MKKTFVSILAMLSLSVLIVGGHADEFDVLVLTDSSPDATVTSNQEVLIYGTNTSNIVTIESGAKAELINFPGNNEITIEADFENFTVFRSGTVLTLNGEDGTILKFPATTDTQLLIFNDTSLYCLIQNGQILLGDQLVSTTLNDKLVGYYLFEGNANDLSGLKYHGTINGAVLTNDRNGIPDSAYEFNNEHDLIHCGNGIHLNLDTHGSIAVWVYPRSSGLTSNGWGRIIHKSGDDAYNMYMSNVSERINIWINNTDISSSNNSVPYNSWSHIAVTFDGNYHKVYINGILDIENFSTGLPENSSSSFYIGNRGGEDRAFDGIIDDVLIYDRVLSDQEISLLFQGVLPEIVDTNSDCVTNFIDEFPDYNQNDDSYGGIPQNYCGPVSVSNAIMYLDNYRYQNLVPNTLDRKKDQYDLILLLGSEDYFNTTMTGTSSNSICNGLEKYFDEHNLKINLKYQGWLSSGVYFVSNIPDLDWIQYSFNNSKVAFLNIGWYTYHSSTFYRQGGHWVTLVGYCLNGNNKYLIIHDPSPQTGNTDHNEYVKLVALSENNYLNYESETISADGFYLMDDGMYKSSLGDYCILDGVIVLELEN